MRLCPGDVDHSWVAVLAVSWRMTSFCRFELRTTDVDAARAFYAQVLGHDRATVWQLHEQALARGARPHWLGHVGVDDVEGAAKAVVERGAERLGPTRATSYGGEAAVLRDPGGAILAAATAPPAEIGPGVEVGFHVLNTPDVTRSAATYRDLFAWAIADEATEGSDHGPFHLFAWSPGGTNVGAFASTRGRPEVHPQWLFFFAVDDVEAAASAARAAGGLVLAPVVSPSGERLYVCDDPQGGAFRLCARPTSK